MAMLMMNDVFQRTWGRPRRRAPTRGLLAHGDRSRQGPSLRFRLIAEAYWDMESVLQEQGFSYCYDKRLYDRLAHENAESVRDTCSRHEPGSAAPLHREHDEPRAAATFRGAGARAGGVLTQTGARSCMRGNSMTPRHCPYSSRRRPPKNATTDLRPSTSGCRRPSGDVFHDGQWQLGACSGWDETGKADLLGFGAATAAKLIVVTSATQPPRTRSLRGMTSSARLAARRCWLGRDLERSGDDCATGCTSGSAVGLAPLRPETVRIESMPKAPSTRGLAEATGTRRDVCSMRILDEWGPYLSERAWGTVREDYSESGDAWDSFPHDMRARAPSAGRRRDGRHLGHSPRLCLGPAL